MATFEQIARAAQGFGEGFQGRGAQFQQGLAREREQEQQQQVGARKRFINELGGAHSLIKGGNIIDAITLLNQSDDPNSRQIAVELQDPAQFEQTMSELNSTVNIATSLGELGTGKKGLASAKTEILPDGSVIQALPNGEVQVRNPQGQIVTGQKRADVLINSQQAALKQQQGLSDIKVTEAGGKEEAKVLAKAAAEAKTAKTVAKTKSFINRAVKLAEKAATEEGEVLTDLARMTAALPGLTDVVGKLRELAPIATSTFGGRVFDTAVKELGFGATKGATASAKFGAMVNNQVLPLLKPTFGAAFTVQEGDSLRATMGDKEASVEEKMATLDAFIEQKQRDIETKQRQLPVGQQAQPAGQPAAGPQEGATATNPQTGQQIIFRNGAWQSQ